MQRQQLNETPYTDISGLTQRYLESGQYEEGIAECRAILAQEKNNPTAIVGLANFMARSGDLDGACEIVTNAIKYQPLHRTYHSLRAWLSRARNDFAQAVAAARFALALSDEQGKADALALLSCCLADAGQPTDAVAAGEQALALEPANRDAHVTLGELAMLRGDAASGWRHFSFLAEPLPPSWPRSDRPKWAGESSPDQTLLLLADQGAGDIIQYARFLPWLRPHFARIVVMAQIDIIPVLARLKSIDLLVTPTETIAAHDFWSCFSYLPAIFNVTSQTIPASSCYLDFDPELSAAWEAILQRNFPMRRLRVGLVWRGNRGFVLNMRRSFDLSALDPLLNLGDIDFISLQHHLTEQDRQDLGARPRIFAVGHQLGDWGSTASLLAQIDILVTIDSGIAHLAAAMGRMVFMLSYLPTEWRWAGGPHDTPWYRSMVLFRQREAGRWGEPIAQMSEIVRQISDSYDPSQPLAPASDPPSV